MTGIWSSSANRRSSSAAREWMTPAAGVDHRPFGLPDGLKGLLHLAHVHFISGPVSLNVRFPFRITELRFFLEHVLGQVHHHRPRTSFARQVKGLLHRGRQIAYVFHQVAVLRARPGNADDVHFLERVVPDHGGGNLPGEDHHGNRVHVCGGDAGDRVGGAGARSHQADADPAAGARVTVGHVGRALLVTDQDVPDPRSAQVEFIVDVQDGPARKAENDFNVFFLETLEKDLCSLELHKDLNRRPHRGGRECVGEPCRKSCRHELR